MRFTKKVVAVVLALVMVASLMPTIVMANTQAATVPNTFAFPFRFNATDLNGNQVTQDSLGQKEIFFVYYWTTWCWGCVEGLPDLARLANEFGDRVGFLSVLGDFGTARDRALEVTRNAGIPFITVDATHRDLRNLMPLLDSGFVPTSVIIGANGQVIGEQMVGGDFNSYSQAIRAALQQTSQVTPTPSPTPTPVQQPINSGAPRPMDIVRIMETPTAGANNVQLTVATGTGVNNVWIQHGNPPRWPQGTMVSESGGVRIWEITFQRSQASPHNVTVYANNGFYTGGATRQDFRITFNPAPFVMPVVVTLPDLNNVQQHWTNGVIAGYVRNHVRQMLAGANNWTLIPSGWDDGWSDVQITQQMERQHELLIRNIVNAWERDPATQMLGVSRTELESIVDRLNAFPFTRIRHVQWDSDGRTWTQLSFSTFHDDWASMSGEGTRPTWTHEWMIDHITHAYLSEIFGRNLNYGRLLSYTIAELFMDTHNSHHSGLDRNTGLYHGLGELAGYSNLFAAARNGQEYFSAWVDLLIPILNSNFTFNHQIFLRAQTNSGAMGWDWNERTQQSVRRTAIDDDFRRVTGVHPDNSWQYFQDAWRSFGTAINPHIAQATRTTAAQGFNNMITSLSSFANRHDTVFIPNWNSFGTRDEARGEGLQHLPSVLDPTTGGFLPFGMEWVFTTSSFPFRFNATDLHGNRVTEASLGERALFFIHITAVWCGSCHDAAPNVAAVSREFGDRVGFITLLEDFSEPRGRAGGLQWARDYGGQYIMVDQHLPVFNPIINLLRLYADHWNTGGGAYPTSMLIDGNGNVLDARFVTGGLNGYRMFIESALAQVAQVVTVQGATPAMPQVTVQTQQNHAVGGIVPLCQVPQFQNNRMGTYQTNGAVANVVRTHIQRYALRHTNHTAETFNITPELQRQSDALLQAILDVWDSDPATRIFGVNRAGMEARFSRVSMFPYTRGANSDRAGFWYGQTHEGWFATHYVDTSGRRVQKPINDIVHVYLYELFGRGEGLGIHLSNTIAEHLMGTGATGYPTSWCCRYTGFQHRVGNRVGLENIFAAARQGQVHYRNWMNEQIRALNASFTFTYDELQQAKVAVGNINRNGSLESQFSRETGIQNVRRNFADAWGLFDTAINPSVSSTQRNNAARQFSEIVQQASRFAVANNLILTWNYQCSCATCNPCLCNDPCNAHRQLPSVHDDNRPMFDLSNPTRGVDTQVNLR